MLKSRGFLCKLTQSVRKMCEILFQFEKNNLLTASKAPQWNVKKQKYQEKNKMVWDSRVTIAAVPAPPAPLEQVHLSHIIVLFLKLLLFIYFIKPIFDDQHHMFLENEMRVALLSVKCILKRLVSRFFVSVVRYSFINLDFNGK